MSKKGNAEIGIGSTSSLWLPKTEIFPRRPLRKAWGVVETSWGALALSLVLGRMALVPEEIQSPLQIALMVLHAVEPHHQPFFFFPDLALSEPFLPPVDLDLLDLFSLSALDVSVLLDGVGFSPELALFAVSDCCSGLESAWLGGVFWTAGAVGQEN
jgi:hypothetical protein